MKMTTNEGYEHKVSISPLLVAGEWDDYAIIRNLTDRDHALPDWVLRVVAGHTRFIQGHSDALLMNTALGHMHRRKENARDVEEQWRNLVVLREIGLRQVMSEYENQRKTNGVEEGDQPS